MNSIPIRQIDQTPAPDRYARGWHCLGLSTTFTDEPSAISAFGTRIVVFRDSAGQAIVLEAICPHMGGDLTMGKVDGDVVRCPYHDWGWGAEGMCLDIPYAKKIPKIRFIVCQKLSICREEPPTNKNCFFLKLYHYFYKSLGIYPSVSNKQKKLT